MGFKIIIVGGSVAGLSLANMLERFNIDYVLLEAYPQIAPQVGASIGLLPNGSRILDQIGCFEPVLGLIGADSCTTMYMRGPDGKMKWRSAEVDASYHVQQRLGYPFFFIDRQMLLRVLHNNIQHKDRILTNERVCRVELVKDTVRVYTENGSCFTADMAVGADGIHSVVRKEMWRVGNAVSPGYFPRNETSRIPACTRCIFGISQRPESLDGTSYHIVSNNGWAYLVAPGPGNRSYWFLFDALAEAKFGDDIPKYSKDDEAALAKLHFDDHITQKATFGELYHNRSRSALVPLEEYVFEKWHFQRIITIGDSAHKFDPASGQGGNGAIESAALLVNAIVQMIESHSGNISGQDIESALSQVHRRRHKRAKQLVQQAHNLQFLISKRHRFANLILDHFLPRVGLITLVDVIVLTCVGAPKIEKLPVPRRRRLILFDDELPAEPIRRFSLRWIPWAFVSTLIGFLLFVTLGGTLVLCPSAQRISHDGCHHVVEGCNLAQREPGLRLMANLLPLLVAWLAESRRYGDVVSPMTILYPLSYLLFGYDSIAPLFCLSSILLSTRATNSRHVLLTFAKSILPAIIRGYVQPYIGILMPIRDQLLRHTIGFLERLSPCFCAALVTGIASTHKWVTKKFEFGQGPNNAAKDDSDITDTGICVLEDTTSFKLAQIFSLTLCFFINLTGLTGISTASNEGAATCRDWLLPKLSRTVLRFFRYHGVIYTTSCMLYSLYTVWHMRLLGYVRTGQALLAALATAATCLIAGPGAAFSGTMYWCEHIVLSLPTVQGERG